VVHEAWPAVEDDEVGVMQLRLYHETSDIHRSRFMVYCISALISTRPPLSTVTLLLVQ